MWDKYQSTASVALGRLENSYSTHVFPNPRAGNNQTYPSVAFNGENYLLVWQDKRDGSEEDIYGARVSPVGVVLDPVGIRISNALFDQREPEVIFDGKDYFVVWQDIRNGADWDVYCTWVHPSGVVVDTVGIAVAGSTGNQLNPSVAFNGTNHLVSWDDNRNSFYCVYGARVTVTGTVLDSAGILVSASTVGEGQPSVASDMTDYLIVWGNGDIYGTRVNSAGVVLDPAGIIVSSAPNGQTRPRVDFDGINYFIAWQDYRNGLNNDIYGARVSPLGLVLDSAGIGIATTSYDEKLPSVGFNGINHLVAWNAVYLYGARLDRAGNLLDTFPRIVIMYQGRSPAVTCGDTNYLVAAFDSYENAYDIYAARVSPAGIPLDQSGIVVSTEANDHRLPTASFDGTNYLAVWQQRTERGDYDLFGARVGQNGAILDRPAIAVSTAQNNQTSPASCFDGTNHFVVWQDMRPGGSYYDIFGARINMNGHVLDTTGFVIAAAPWWQGRASVAFDGTNYLVVWEDQRSGSKFDIRGARVSPAGITLDTASIAISTVSDDQTSPSVAFDGTNYLVVWEDRRTGYWDIFGARVSKSGAVLEPSGMAISNARGWQYSPSVVFGQDQYFVVWTDNRNGITDDIYGTRVTVFGTVLDTEGIALTRPDYKYEPAIVFDSTHYIMVWEDKRSYFYYDVYGARVSQSGIVIDSFPVSVQAGSQLSPKIAHGPGDQVLVVYSGWTDSINGRPANTMRIWGKLLPPVGIEENQILNIKYRKVNLQIYPNPFRRQVQIKLGMGHRAEGIELKIHDVSGRSVKSFPLTRYSLLATSSISWDGADDSGRQLPAGVYFCILECEDKVISKKIVRVD